MALFGLFGDDESQQRRNQILAYFAQEQQRQQAAIQQQQQAAIDAQLAANRNIAAPAPTVNPSVSQAQSDETALNDYRSGLARDLDTTYGPDYSYKTFADTADDAIVNSILGKQRDTAQTAIDMAKSRGQLNTAGYNAALSGLNDAQTAATSDASTVGSGVLSRYRQNLDDALASLRSGASGAALNSFDLEGGKTGIANRIADMNKNLAGDISAAVGAKNYFDTGKILGTAGAQQGIINPGATTAVDPNAADELRRRRTNVNQVF